MDECAMARNVPRARAHLEVKSASWLQPRRPRKRACVRVLQKGLSQLKYATGRQATVVRLMYLVMGL